MFIVVPFDCDAIPHFFSYMSEVPDTARSPHQGRGDIHVIIGGEEGDRAGIERGVGEEEDEVRRIGGGIGTEGI